MKLKMLLATALWLFCVSCSRSRNYTEAYISHDAGHNIIKMKGKRPLMAHDPIGLFMNGTYEDSLVLTIDSVRTGVIYGKDIPTPKGYYRYFGEIKIDGDNMKVDLYWDNTDDHRSEPVSWNGTYELIEKDWN